MYKLFTNSVYRKWLQFDECYNKSKIVKSWKKFLQMISKRYVKNYIILAFYVNEENPGII